MTFDITKHKHKTIKDPDLNIALYQPEIPSNTGSIARLCGAAQVRLHLIHPLGFHVTDKHLKRAGLDYWYEVDVRHHVDFNAFMETVNINGRNVVGFSRHAKDKYIDINIKKGDFLLFGPETLGLPDDIKEKFQCCRLPIRGNVRSLNLATTVGIAAYHYLNEMGKL